jgi:putative ABC transport system ATP-binding protein
MIRLQQLNKIFNENQSNAFHALKDISLHVKRGELVILKGISGSGKSTLLSLIGALSKPTSGSIEVNGEQIAKLPDLHASRFRAQNLGFIFQSFNLFEELSVADNIALPLIHQKQTLATLDDAVNHAMKMAKIEHKAKQEVRLLSGGEKQRCAIARALVNSPDIILCDEPTANLDHNNALSFLETLQTLQSEGKTILIATHDPIFETLNARTIEISNGVIENL